MTFFQFSSRFILSTSSFLMLTNAILAHGLIVNPPSRNAYCGLNEKPHNATSEACIDAFANTGSEGYQFMSVLTHTQGRQFSTSTHVCGFDSETWEGGATPWDIASDWPSSSFSSGTQVFTWNILWGPHWDDTEEFVFYITKPDFVFDRNNELTWDNFEDEPFCVQKYDDANPEANPDVQTQKDDNLFHVTCDVPSREGHHVIYGEWGRNQWTYERFHSCMDVNMQE